MAANLDATALLAMYDDQLRAHLPEKLPVGASVDWDGPVLRGYGFGHGGFIVYRDVSELTSAGLDELIARQRDFFAARGEQVEWKLHGHDEPADLPDRLVAAGFQPEELEAVVIGAAAPLADAQPRLPEGVRLRQVTARADLDRIDDLKVAVWGGPRWTADMLEKELAADPDQVTVVVAEHDDLVVSAAWIRYVPGTPFAGLWGGATLTEFRGRGIYRALVGYRAALAVARGYRYLQVDASPDSRPILERLGFVAVTTTTPYIWSPAV